MFFELKRKGLLGCYVFSKCLLEGGCRCPRKLKVGRRIRLGMLRVGSRIRRSLVRKWLCRMVEKVVGY